MCYSLSNKDRKYMDVNRKTYRKALKLMGEMMQNPSAETPGSPMSEGIKGLGDKIVAYEKECKENGDPFCDRDWQEIKEDIADDFHRFYTDVRYKVKCLTYYPWQRMTRGFDD